MVFLFEADTVFFLSIEFISSLFESSLVNNQILIRPSVPRIVVEIARHVQQFSSESLEAELIGLNFEEIIFILAILICEV